MKLPNIRIVVAAICVLIVALAIGYHVHAQTIAGAPAYQLPVTVVPQNWFGSGPPTAALNYGSQPGDFYHDTLNKITYQCAAPVTAFIPPNTGGPPACSAVAAGQWTVIASGSGNLDSATAGVTFTGLPMTPPGTSSRVLIVTGTTAAFDGASPATATITGMPPFSRTNSFWCFATINGTATTHAITNVTNQSTTSVKFYATNGATETAQYGCFGT